MSLLKTTLLSDTFIEMCDRICNEKRYKTNESEVTPQVSLLNHCVQLLAIQKIPKKSTTGGTADNDFRYKLVLSDRRSVSENFLVIGKDIKKRFDNNEIK